MSIVIVVAPHPDDETLGCGGTILRHIHNGDCVYWLIVTSINEINGFTAQEVSEREKEINRVRNCYQFQNVLHAGIFTTQVDQESSKELVRKISDIFREINPNIVYMPFKGDIHSDHKVIFDAVSSCTKSFRYSSIQRVLCYETISETDFSIDPTETKFSPNVFIDITDYIDQKIEIMKLYKTEIKEYPFPRSTEAIRALAMIRGVAAGKRFAESFMLLREII